MTIDVTGLLPLLLIVIGGGSFIILAYNIHQMSMRNVLKKHRADEGSPEVEVERIKAKDRTDARALYERITLDKLEVIKTALAMGYTKRDLAELDDRLEELIGSDKLHRLLDDDSPTTVSVEGEIFDADLVRQLEILHPHTESE